MFTVPRCEKLESNSRFDISLSDDDPMYGTTATYSCVEGTIEGGNISTCLCDGWSAINPECTTTGGRNGDDGKTQCQGSPT